ncbi:MAG: hypothetical protein IIX04_00100, partial [Alistipes sp.]|nr:hypothetical protein [Alistipes sp.]
VGSGKTKLLEDLCAVMAKDYSIGVITNDITYTSQIGMGDTTESQPRIVDHMCWQRR